MDSRADRHLDPRIVAIDRARASVARLETAVASSSSALRQAVADRDRLTRSGARKNDIEQAETRIDALRREHDAARDALRQAAVDVLDRRSELVKDRGPDALVETLAGTHPVAMLPVRLETRFFDNGGELRIRIFPDQVHLDHHDPALTVDEQAAADWYWTERQQGGGDPARANAAWSELVRRLGAPRAAWIVEGARPGVSPATRASSAARPSVAAGLPDRWLAVGYRNGQEQFRKWSAKAVPDRLVVGVSTDPAEADGHPPPPDTLPLPEDLKWVSDYAEAEARGMAITVKPSDVIAGRPALSGGIDRLIVVGVDWTGSPARGAETIERLLDAHLFSDGLSVAPQGTPTNNTVPAAAAQDAVNASTLDPIAAEAAAATPTTLALAQLFGLADRPSLRRIAGGQCSEQETAQRLLSAVWSSTLGAYLARMLDPLIDAPTQAAVRGHAVAYLRPSGVMPALRIGKQPYGILPVLPRRGFAGDGPFEVALARVLDDIRRPWSIAIDRVPRVDAGPLPDDPNGTLDARLTRILQHAPVAVSARFRRLLSATTAANTSVPGDLKDVQERLLLLLLAHFGWTSRPFIASLVAEPAQYPLPVPFVQATTPAAAPIAPNYIAEIAALLQSASPRRALERRLTEMQGGDTLLQVFLALAAIQAIDAGTLAVLTTRMSAEHATQVQSGYFPVDDTVHVAKAGEPRSQAVAISTPGDAAQVVIADIDRSRPVSELVGAALRDADLRQKLPENAIQPLRTLMADLAYLQARNGDELDWAFRGVLDCMSYRLDAWITSLAHRRLRELRRRAGRATGVHVGGYAFVEHLQPAAPADSLGYVLTPSLAHAATAAILRSGYAAHADAGQAALDIDLTSARVAQALKILDGVARGQPLAALLGYRLERGLRTTDPRLARFILPIRSVAPLRPVRANSARSAGPSESVAERDVADGVTLVDRLRSNRAQLLTDIKAAATSSPQAAAAIAALMPAVERELDAVSQVMDSISDVLVTESVHQTLLGNHERAAAALGVLDRQTRPLQPQVVETPRTGHAYTQRAAVLTLESIPVAPGIAVDDPVLRAWAPLSTDARAAAEPRLNAWLARVLGDPRRYEFAADLITQGDDAVETRTALDAVTLEALGLSPLMVLASAASGTQNGPSELHRRLVAAFVKGHPNPGSAAAIELKRDAARGAALGLGALEGLLALLQKLVSRARALDNRDFALPSSAPATTIAVADLAARSTAAVNRIRALATPLGAALDADPIDPAAVFHALTALSDAGVMGALPTALDASGLQAGSEAVLRLLDQARDTRAMLSGAGRRIDALDTAWTARADKPPSAEVEHHTARIRELLGKDFALITPFDLTDASELAASLADQPALMQSDPLTAADWLQRLALVRPPLDRLAAVLTAADVIGTMPNTLGLSVAQLPHTPGQGWLALPHKGSVPRADLALVLQSFSPLAIKTGSQTLAGFFVDDWSEMIPASEETVAATFHYNAPGSRPPQAILLATPPTLSLPNWTTELLLDVVNEALDLAHLRMVGPEQLDFHGLLLPAIYLPDAFSPDVPSINLGRMKDLAIAKLASAAAGKQSVWNSQ